MALLDKAALAAELQLETEDVPLQSGSVRVTELSAAEYAEICSHPALRDEDGQIDGQAFMSLLAAHCVVDEQGQRLLDDEDRELFSKGSSTVYTRILEAVKRLNGIGDDNAKN